MSQVRTFLLALLLTASTANALELQFGLSLSKNEPEQIELSDPLGVIRLEHKTDKGNTIFCEHVSSIPDTKDGIGINHCGFLIEL